MQPAAQLWLFAAVVLAVVLLPGLDMAFVLASSLVGGRRAGFSAVGGIVTGAVCHVLVATTGIAVFLEVMPSAFDALLWVGALYVAYVGVSIFRSGSTWRATPAEQRRGPWRTYGRGLLTNLLNPKAYLFMLAVFPQFLRPERGLLWLQALMLWLIIAVSQTVVYGAVALGGEQARHWLEANPAANAAIARFVGALLVLAALVTAFHGRR